MVRIAASIMAEGFSQDALDQVKSADLVHFDIKDDDYVPGETINALVVEDLHTDLIKEVHLMVRNPEEFIDPFADAGAKRISFHPDATQSPEAVIGLIQAKKIKAGISLNPDIVLKDVMELLEECDYIQIMSVHPGKSGQSFLDKVLNKVLVLRDKFPEKDIEIDGGINLKTAEQSVLAGITTIVSDTFLFSGGIPEEKINELRSLS